MKKNKGITLIALVITIVIMLLLASVAIQMAMGENGLIAKSVQAQKQQAKSELYENAKLSYTNLKVKALENGQPIPEADLALATTEFRDKYDIVGDDITDKQGNVIDTKANVLNIIQGTVAGGFTGSTSSPTPESWPKTVGGVTIPEEDKDKMVLKVKVSGNTGTIVLRGRTRSIDYGNSEGIQETNMYIIKQLTYNQGEYILKISNYSNFEVKAAREENIEIEILQWGKPDYTRIDENSTITLLENISKIYEPELDKVPITYVNGKFTEIPEWLFSNKITSKKMSSFIACKQITNIPENLFKTCINIEEFQDTFKECTGLRSIPENLFKYNTKVKRMYSIFDECRGLKNIPEKLFKYNTEVVDFSEVFSYCSGLISIPEELFKYNTEVKQFYREFTGCVGLRSIPKNLFKYNTKAKRMVEIFNKCTGLTSIPEELFKYNTEVKEFNSVFSWCIGLTSIPEELFKYNTTIENVSRSFETCYNITYIPEKIIEVVKKVKENGGSVNEVFAGCTSASNYSSIPSYMKE